jgi:hypothetical protein
MAAHAMRPSSVILYPPSAAVALYFMYYNFGRVHQTLRVTPAMEAGVADHVWSIEEIVRVADVEKAKPPSFPLKASAC